MMTDQEPRMTESKLNRKPPHGWLRESLAALWHRKSTVIAALSVLAILVHLMLRFAFQVESGQPTSFPCWPRSSWEGFLSSMNCS